MSLVSQHRKSLLLGLACLAAAGCVHAQGYPAKSLRLIVPFSAGGPTDILARFLGQKLTESWGRQVVIDNRPGGAGNIGAELVAKSAPDGYTLLLATAGILTVNPHLFRKLPFDTLRDFAPVTLAAYNPNILVVHPSLPVKSVKELIQLARKRPGELSYGSAGVGSASHLATETFKSIAGIDIVHVPYKGAAPGVNDLIGGHVQMMLIGLPVALPHVRSGKLRALGVSTPKRSPLAPELPTISESGLPGFQKINWLGLLVPAATPKEIVARLNAEVVRILRLPDTRTRLLAQGFEPVGGTPEQLTEYMKTELAKAGEIVKKSGIKAD